MPTSALRILAVLSIMLMQQAPADEETLIQKISDVLSLDPEIAAKGIPVQLEGQILWKNASDDSFFLHSDSHGIYVNCEGIPLPEVHLVGDRVKINGVSHEGNYSTAVIPEKIETLSADPLPRARPFEVSEIWSPKNDCDWVQFTARVTAITLKEREKRANLIILSTNFKGQRLRVEIAWSAPTEKRLRDLLFLPVKFTAIAGTQYNKNRQIVGRVMYVTTFSRTTQAEEELPPSDISTKAIHELSRSNANLDELCRIHGVVIHFDERYLYLRGEDSCIRASIREIDGISIGDRVELDGFVQPERIGPSFLARDVRIIESLPSPDPVRVEPHEILPKQWFRALYSRFHNELIELDAQIVETNTLVSNTGKLNGHYVLCRQGNHLFDLDLSATQTIPNDWKPGAVLRIKGICLLEHTDDINMQLYADQFHILARSVSDIELLKPAPWWTKGKLYALAAITLALGGAFSLWVLSLKRIVAGQLETIGFQVEKESVLNERQRIARDLHDTLEQGLSALKMQLKLIHRKLKNKLPDELYTVEAAEKMLAACSRESRGAIEDMRGGPWETMNLSDAIRNVIGPRVESAGVQFQLNCPKKVERLSPFAEQQIIRLISEAVANALKHAAPSLLKIELNSLNEMLEFKISDDGCGFDIEAAKQSGRFGILGMYERANRLNTTLSIKSVVGNGTRIHFSVPTSDFQRARIK